MSGVGQYGNPLVRRARMRARTRAEGMMREVRPGAFWVLHQARLDEIPENRALAWKRAIRDLREVAPEDWEAFYRHALTVERVASGLDPVPAYEKARA